MLGCLASGSHSRFRHIFLVSGVQDLPSYLLSPQHQSTIASNILHLVDLLHIDTASHLYILPFDMTQPTTVDMTFDTSLVDLKPNTSFSTTESDSSDHGAPNSDPTFQTPKIEQHSLFEDFEDRSQKTPKHSQQTQSSRAPVFPKSSTPVQHVPTQDAYDQWATVYDSDGNMLQAIDDLELTSLLPAFLQQVQSSVVTPTISLLDLGCGTGRNTAKLLSYPVPLGRQITVTGLDFSRGMLDIASQKLQGGVEGGRVKLAQCECFPTTSNPSASPFPSVPNLSPVNALISTLVLEHIPLTPFFATISSLLLPGGLALVTNMHEDMGKISQAGFVNKQGMKVRGESWVYSVQETLDEAVKRGFEVLSVTERDVRKEDLERGVGMRGRKWVGVRVWYGVVLKKVG
jgi:SAM-dependent methyltransferase